GGAGRDDRVLAGDHAPGQAENLVATHARVQGEDHERPEVWAPALSPIALRVVEESLCFRAGGQKPIDFLDGQVARSPGWFLEGFSHSTRLPCESRKGFRIRTSHATARRII